MTFDIDSVMRKRAKILANKYKTTVKKFLGRALVVGMETLENTPETANAQLIKNQSVQITEKPNQRVSHFSPSPLTPEQKECVRANMTAMTNLQIAEQLECTISEVMQAKNEITEAFVRANWEKMTDGEMGRAFGCIGAQISRIRHRLGLRRKTGGDKHKKIQIAITKEGLEKALTEEGLTLEEFAKKPRVSVSRERIRQIADNLGVKNEKTPLWYANRLGKPELGNKEWLEKALAEKGSVSAVGNYLALRHGDVEKIKKIYAMHGIVLQKQERPNFQGTVELHCHHCTAAFTLNKSQMKQIEKKGIKRHFCGDKCFHEWARTHGSEFHFKK